MVSRKGVFRLFQVGTLRPSLSLPRPVSTTIRRDGVSTTSEWIDILSRPSSVAKCGISHGNFWISSLVARGKINRVLPTVSSSTTFVILTLPIFQCIRHFPLIFVTSSSLRRCLSRAVDDDGAELVALLHCEVRLRRLRQRKLRGDVVDALAPASHREISVCAVASKAGGSAGSTSARTAMHLSISSRIGTTGLRLPLVA